MIRAASGLSLHPDPRTAGEEAALAALAACEGATHVLAFASHHHAAGFAALLAGVEGLAGRASVTGCTGFGVATEAGVVAGRPAAAVLAIAADGLVLRPGQRPRGPADPILLAREMGAPRGMQAYLLWAGPAAGDAEALLAGMTAGLPGYAADLAGAWGEPATAIGSQEVEPGGTLAWLLAGECSVAAAIAPARPPAFGIYLGTAGAPPPAFPAFPAYPVAGLLGASALAAGGGRVPGLLVAVSPA
jgi:hypothetical protein